MELIKTEDLESEAVHGNSLFVQKCRRYDLDPQKTSNHELVCAMYYLDPQKTSVLDLARIRFKISEEQSVEKLIGKDWVHQVYRY